MRKFRTKPEVAKTTAKAAAIVIIFGCKIVNLGACAEMMVAYMILIY